MITKAIAFSAGSLAALASAAPASPEAIEAVSKWPVTVVLGAVCCFCVYLMYRQGADYRASLDKVADSLNNLSKNLAERPCIRDPKND
ncbi:MAG: hypothetical protein KA248_15320 [Kiritimatiellae bacterium]|nr:hypothetical protein [Kiritimatiellia bacterium]